jgi:hypothetical protein
VKIRHITTSFKYLGILTVFFCGFTPSLRKNTTTVCWNNHECLFSNPYLLTIHDQFPYYAMHNQSGIITYRNYHLSCAHYFKILAVIYKKNISTMPDWLGRLVTSSSVMQPMHKLFWLQCPESSSWVVEQRCLHSVHAEYQIGINMWLFYDDLQY